MRGFFMVTIYVIQSINTNKLYVGMTEDLQNRLREHNAGKSKYTATFKPWKVIYSETAENFETARKEEKGKV
ncbi:MAG: GIY-YIG nuclease family protein [Ferruginibacter sp.]